jgi:hypothetical protein
MATSAFNKFNSFTEAVAEKVHNLGSDTLELALTNTAPVNTNTQLSNITQITYTNLNARTLTVSGSSQTAGVYKLTIADKTLTSTGGSTGPFRYVVLFNQTATNDELIGWYDYGSSITLGDGESLLVNFDDANGVLTIT